MKIQHTGARAIEASAALRAKVEALIRSAIAREIAIDDSDIDRVVVEFKGGVTASSAESGLFGFHLESIEGRVTYDPATRAPISARIRVHESAGPGHEPDLTTFEVTRDRDGHQRYVRSTEENAWHGGYEQVLYGHRHKETFDEKDGVYVWDRRWDPL